MYVSYKSLGRHIMFNTNHHEIYDYVNDFIDRSRGVDEYVNFSTFRILFAMVSVV